MATHSGILVWKIPWTEESGGLQSIASQRVGHNLATEHTHTHKLMQLNSVFISLFGLSVCKRSKKSFIVAKDVEKWDIILPVGVYKSSRNIFHINTYHLEVLLWRVGINHLPKSGEVSRCHACAHRVWKPNFSYDNLSGATGQSSRQVLDELREQSKLNLSFYCGYWVGPGREFLRVSQGLHGLNFSLAPRKGKQGFSISFPTWGQEKRLA